MVCKEVRVLGTGINGCYRVLMVLNDNLNVSLRVFEGLPADKSSLPPDAPEAEPILLAIVDEAEFLGKEDFKEFDKTVEEVLLKKFSRNNLTFTKCSVYYPSPAFNFD